MNQNIFKLILLINILIFSTSYCKTKVIISIGYSYVSNNNDLINQDIKNLGMNAELILPIQIIGDNLYYKTSILYHKMEYTTYEYSKRYYIASINELQIGYEIFRKNNTSIQSFIGFGFMVQHKYSPGIGYSYGSFVFDFTNYFMYDFKNMNIGLKVSFLYSPCDGYFNSISDKYFQFGLCVSK